MKRPCETSTDNGPNQKLKADNEALEQDDPTFQAQEDAKHQRAKCHFWTSAEVNHLQHLITRLGKDYDSLSKAMIAQFGTNTFPEERAYQIVYSKLNTPLMKSWLNSVGMPLFFKSHPEPKSVQLSPEQLDITKFANLDSPFKPQKEEADDYDVEEGDEKLDDSDDGMDYSNVLNHSRTPHTQHLIFEPSTNC